MNIGAVGLANNHALDFGEQALEDTLEGRPDSLGRSGPSQTVISFRLPTAQTFDQLPGDLRRVVASSNGEVTIRTTEPTSVLSRLCDWAMERGLELPGLEVAHPSLEDVYLQLTEGGRDGGD